MTSPEAYITFSPQRSGDDGEVLDESTAALLKDYMAEFRDHVVRVLTVLPPSSGCGRERPSWRWATSPAQ